MTLTRVAVIITCCDLGRTLEEALQSVLGQTLPASEVVIVDDGSSDLYTQQILGRLDRAGHTVIHTINRGFAAARNTGIRSTQAPYIVLLDAEDLLEPTYIEQAAAALEANPALAFVSCGMNCFGAATEAPPPPDLIESMAHSVVHISSMFRREMWDAVGGFDESFPAYEDVDFWTRVLERGCRGEVLPQALLRYRIRPGSVSRSAIRRDRHLALMEQFYRKHLTVVTANAERLLVAKERFILEQRSHHDWLVNRRTVVAAELQRLEGEIDDIVRELKGVGRDRVEPGDFRRTTPISPFWGLDRGQPLDRYYIESFLDRHRSDIRGRVLEIKDAAYTRKFGDDRVTASDVLDIDPNNAEATLVADLTRADGIPQDRFECAILTQTLGLIYDVRAALATTYRTLKPGGVLLCTVPASGRISYEPSGLDNDYWRFTEASLRQLFAEVFPIDGFEITGYGNVLARAAFLYGLAPNELSSEELNETDPFFPVIYGIRAVRPPLPPADSPSLRRQASHAAVLMYHRIADPPAGGHARCVAPKNFRAHLQQLRNHGCHVVPLRDLACGLHAGDLPPRTVAITLDDGYLDALTDAAGILAELSLPATIFVVGAAVRGPHEFWWDVLERVFAGGSSQPQSLQLELPGGVLELRTSTRHESVDAHARIRDVMYTLPLGVRDHVLRQVMNWSGTGEAVPSSVRPMTSSELLKLAAVKGIDIGAHSENHVWLPSQPRDVVMNEVRASKQRLQHLLGREIATFSYPYGGHDARIVEVVRKEGFEAAVTTEERSIKTGDDTLTLPRYEIRDLDNSAFADRLRRILDF